MWKKWSTMCHTKAIFFALVLLVAMVYIFYIATYRHESVRNYPEIVKPSQEDVNYRREMAEKLADIIREIRNLDCKVDPRIPLRLNAIIGQLDSRSLISDRELLRSEVSNHNVSEGAVMEDGHEVDTDVCSDSFISTRTGYPFYQQNDPPPTTCSGAKHPINEMITILVNNVPEDIGSSSDSPQRVLPPDRLEVLLKDIRGYHQHIPVIIADLDAKINAPFLQAKFGKVEMISVHKREATSPGGIWNALVRQVTTPYVLLGRDLQYFNAFARLERQIYVISVSDVVAVAGGAFRNTTGHWRVGCYQSEMKNYDLRYTEGYRYSAYGCMFCDHLEGPFVARANVLREVPFKETLPSVVVFEDWFLFLKQSAHLVVSCPDAMYFVHGGSLANLYDQHQKKKSSWLKLARKWELHRIFVRPNVVYVFSCEEIGLSCDAFKSVKYYLLPSCCLVEMARTWRALEDFASQYNIPYEMESGTMLGAVKLGSQLPWDLDADVFFRSHDYSTFYKKRSYFHNQGFRITKFKPEDKYFQIWTPNIMIEMHGMSSLSTTYLPANLHETPTRIKVLGVWLPGVSNPGLYVRNRFGFDYLRHASHWRKLGLKGPFESYSPPMRWLACPRRYHHACLDHYPTDGSIEFVPSNIPQ